MSYRCILQNGVFYCRKVSGEGQLPVNTAPVATAAAYTVTGDTLTVAAPGLVALCTDAESNPMASYVVAQPSQGTVTVYQDGSFVYQRAINSAYSTYFTYRVQDSKGLFSNTAIITLNVDAIVVPSVPPVATGGAYTVPASQVYSASAPGVLTGDYGEGTLTAYKVTDPAHGTVTVATNGSFVYTPTTGYTGSDTFTYRCYNGTLYSTPATITMTIVAVNATTIDAAWIATHTAPYVLSAANTTYTMDVDVTTDDTAFVFSAAGITLDLNGHTILYGNRAPLALQNGTWSEGAIGAAPPHWDLTNAPSAAVVANSTWSPAANCTQVLTLTGVTTAQYIESDPVAIPHWPHKIMACSWVKGPSSGTVVTAFYNADTDVLLASETHQGLNRGFAQTVFYSATSALNVKVRVTMSSTTPTSFTVGQVYLNWSDDYGICAISSASYRPVQLAGYTLAGNNPTVKNGTLTQGQGASYWGHAINVQSNQYLTVDNMVISNCGVDTSAVYGMYSYHGIVTNSSIDATNIPNITNRMHEGTCLKFQPGSATITDNTITGAPRMGIYAGQGDNTVIQRNVITPRGLVTEGYGICVSGNQTCDISYNTITATVSGRGIFIDGLWADQRMSNNVEIHHNTVDIQENSNFEYGPDGLEATAMRVRCFQDDYHHNISIHDNSFTARTSTGKVYGAVACRLSEIYNSSGLPIGVSLTNNTFTSIVTASGATYVGMGFDFGEAAAGTDITVTGNTFSSNHISLAFGSNDGGVSYDGIFTSNIVNKSAEGSGKTHVSIRVGCWYGGPQNVTITDMQYSGGASESFTYDGTGPTSITTQWYLTIYAYDSVTLLPVADVAVTLRDKANAVVLTAVTDANGLVTNAVVTGKLITGSLPTPTTDNRTPHTLSMTKTTYSPYTETITFTSSKTVNIAMVAVV